MNLGLNNKRFLITGASRGIGKAIAFRFIKEGARLVITARGKETLGTASEELAAEFSGGEVIDFSGDSTSPSEMEALKSKIMKVWGGLDGVVANVGDGRSVSDPIPEADQWEKVWKANFKSALITSRVFLPMLKESNGCLLYISSITGVEAIGAPVDYSTAKSALNAFSKNLSRKAAPNVRVNVIAPGNVYFPGGSWDDTMKTDEKIVKKMIKNTVPLQRFGKPEEIADAAAFLCSEKASFITGSILRVDGGQTVSL